MKEKERKIIGITNFEERGEKKKKNFVAKKIPEKKRFLMVILFFIK